MAVQDPSISGVSGRYATALYEMASDEKCVDEVGKNLASVGQMLDESEDLERLVRSPVFGSDEQWAALSAVLKKAKIGGLTHNFVGLVAKNRRLFVLRDMVTAYGKLVAHARGEVSAEVTSAEKLSAAHVKKLKAALKEQVGRDVQMEEKVNPDILGGLIVKVGSRMVDNSLRTKLNNLKIAMKEVG
ncbi:MAG: F0F1 ATP synthase subunit delta [Pseudomonadota bacterium]